MKISDVELDELVQAATEAMLDDWTSGRTFPDKRAMCEHYARIMVPAAVAALREVSEEASSVPGTAVNDFDRAYGGKGGVINEDGGVSRYVYGPHLWEVCDDCNYARHRCPGCGDDLSHVEARITNGHLHPCFKTCDHGSIFGHWVSHGRGTRRTWCGGGWGDPQPAVTPVV